jgi:hypothetical protein
MTRTHERRVSGRYRFLGHTLTLEASFQVGERDLFADVEHPSLEALDVEHDVAGEEWRSVFDSKLLKPVRRPHVRETIAVVKQHIRLVAERSAHAAEMS